jgi:hypothetical protein
MKLLGIELNGIAVSLGITLVICGAVVYYCQNRIKNIEMALIKQNQVLSSFIANVQNEIKNGTMTSGGFGGGGSGNSPAKLIVDNNELASEEARLAVSQLIEVSEDEESDDEEESESDDDDESESDDDEQDNNSIRVIELGNLNQNKTKHVEGLNSFHQQQQQHIPYDLNEMNHLNVKIIELMGGVGGIETIETESIASNENSSDDEEEEEEDLVENNNVSSVQIVEETLMEISNLNITNNKEEHNTNNTNIDINTIETLIDEDLTNNDFLIKKIITNFSKEAAGAGGAGAGGAGAGAGAEDENDNLEKMKVDDLRDLALSKGLSTKNEVKKFKKVELLHLLQK